MVKTVKPGANMIITHEGIPEAVVMSFEEYEGWMETFDIMSNPEEAAELRGAMKEVRKGKITDTIDLDTLKKQLKL